MNKKENKGRVDRIAAAVVNGSTVTAIAQAEGVSRATASAAVHSPAVQIRITELVDAEAVRIRALFSRTLDVIEEGLGALDYKITMQRLRKTFGKDMPVPTEDELEFTSPPDHYARLAAAKRLLEITTTGRRPVQETAPDAPVTVVDRTYTLDELEALHTGATSSDDSRA